MPPTPQHAANRYRVHKLPTMSTTKKRPGFPGEFGKDTPPLEGTAANVNMWFAAWHLDHGHTVAEADIFVDILRELKWTPIDIHGISVNKLLQDIRSCGYEYKWAPRLAGDMHRAMTLKYSNSVPIPRTPFHDLPDLVIPPNADFIHNTPPASAATAEVRDWLRTWFDNRPDDPEFKRCSMKFEYQCPIAFLEEVPWDGSDILFFSIPYLKKTSLSKFLRGGYFRALASDIREGRRRMRARLSTAEFRTFQVDFNGRARASL